MSRAPLRSTLTIGVTLVLTVSALYGVGLRRRAEDARWCRSATARAMVPPGTEPRNGTLLERQRSVCADQRQRQRVMFGAVWRKDGRAMAECGFELGRLQLLSEHDADARDAILASNGIEATGFDSSSSADQSRFLSTCVSSGRSSAR